MRVDPKDIYQYLRDKGVGHEHAMGMVANIGGESGFDSGIQEVRPLAGRGGYGLFQHTGPRRRALERYCEEKGCDVWDWQAQVDFALQEPDSGPYLTRPFKTPAEAAEWFLRRWERPAEPDRDLPRRLAILNRVENTVA